MAARSGRGRRRGRGGWGGRRRGGVVGRIGVERAIEGSG